MNERRQSKASIEKDDHLIVLKLEGSEDDGGALRLNQFTKQLERFNKVLNGFDRLASGGQRANGFKLVRLSYASPYEAAVEPVTLPGRHDTRAAVRTRFRESATAIAHGTIPAEIDSQLLEDFRELARPTRDYFRSVILIVDNTLIDLDQKFASTLDDALASVDTSLGTVEGRLEWANLHGDANLLYLYPEIGPTKIKCRISSDLREVAASYLLKRVSVKGELRYRARSDFPHEVVAEEIEVMPNDSDLPVLDDLRGIAPDAWDGLSSEDFIRKVRDGWE